MNRELLKQVLYALNDYYKHTGWESSVADEIRAELDKPEPEPFAWGIEISGKPCDVYINKDACTIEFDRRQRDYPDQSRKLHSLYTKDQL